METPTEWPREIADSYDPIRILGRGGFASVMLAKKKKTQESNSGEEDDSTTSIPSKVAIKIVGCNNGTGNDSNAALYARREIELLQQIRHCGIVTLYHSWELNNDEGSSNDDERSKQQHQHQLSSPTAGVLVLEYLKGPTVESLLTHGGALSTNFGRIIIAQVMDAISYLHYRAVLHRDIKPDNIIVTGALSSDDFIWDNDDNETLTIRDNKSPEDWKRLCMKYKATIIDFGFARALTPEDMDDPASAKPTHHPNKKDTGYHNIYKKDEKDLEDRKQRSGGGLRKRFNSRSNTSISEIDTSHHSAQSTDTTGTAGSVSHKMKRVMSTLGNRHFAAPEIIGKVRRFSAQDKKKEKQKHTQRTSKTTNTISEFVADYGLLVDSYSMGHTIRYMMTGVPPGTSVEDTIKKQQRSGMAKKVMSKLGLGKKKKDSSSQKKKLRKPVYRSLNNLPGQVFLLVEGLTQIDPHKRMSIRKARRTVAWISNTLSFQKNIHNYYDEILREKPRKDLSLELVSEEQLYSLQETRYLPLATNTPGSVVSTHGNQTVKTSMEMSHEFQLDSSDSSNNNISGHIDFNFEDIQRCSPIEDETDDAIGLNLTEGAITF